MHAHFRNTAYATTKSSQNCFLGAQKEKHLLRKQTVFEKKSETFFVSEFPQQMFPSCANRETFRETCFLNNVSSFAGAVKLRKTKITRISLRNIYMEQSGIREDCSIENVYEENPTETLQMNRFKAD